MPPTTGVTAFTETHTTKDITASPRPTHHFSTPSFQTYFPQNTKRASPTWSTSASKPTSQTSAHQPAQTFLLLPQTHIKCWLAQTSTITACSPHHLKNHYMAWPQPTNTPRPYLSQNKPPAHFHSNQWPCISSLPSQQT